MDNFSRRIQLVNDNGPELSCEEFMAANGKKHSRVAPYHLSSNGLAERAVGYAEEWPEGGSGVGSLCRTCAGEVPVGIPVVPIRRDGAGAS